MPRRAKSSITGVQVVIIIAVVAVGILGGVFLMAKSTDPYATLTVLPVRDYADDWGSMRGNEYKVRGRVSYRADRWDPKKGRLFKLSVQDGVGEHPIPILVPSELNGKNIIRDQEYQFRVRVDDNNGMLMVKDVSNI